MPRSTPETKAFGQSFRNHRNDAKNRGISFLFTFEEWLKVWVDSGHLSQRGSHNGQYVMARFGDKGPYAKDNVRIIKAEENQAERVASKETRAKMRKAKLGNTFRRGAVLNEASKLKMSLAKKGRTLTAEHRRKIGLGVKRYFALAANGGAN